MQIREARASDLPRRVEIYDHRVAHALITFDLERVGTFSEVGLEFDRDGDAVWFERGCEGAGSDVER